MIISILIIVAGFVLLIKGADWMVNRGIGSLLAGGTLVLFIAMFTGGRRKLDRWEAAVLLAIYIFYTIYLIAGEI